MNINKSDDHESKNKVKKEKRDEEIIAGKEKLKRQANTNIWMEAMILHRENKEK